MRHARIGLLSAMIGNIVEWYDFALYTAATPLVFASLFFSSNISAFQNQIEAIGLFASGFIARPLGGIFLGRWEIGTGTWWPFAGLSFSSGVLRL